MDMYSGYQSDRQDVLVTREGDVVRITLNRPEQRNALTVQMMDTISRAIVDAGHNRMTRAIVLTGTGDRAFCAGADLTPDDTPFVPSFAETHLPFANLLRNAYDSQVPIIGAINGTCVAGGMGLLGICDIAVASTAARFGMPEVKIGVFPMQIVAVLRDLIPARAMSELCLTGRMIQADEALALGLVNRVVEPHALEDEIVAFLDELVAGSPTAVRRGKYAMRAMAHMTFEQMIAFAESQVTSMIMTGDAREGLKAFAEKRAPVWTGS